MDIVIRLRLDVGEEDNKENAVEAAQNQMRSMDFEELLSIMDYIMED